MQKFDTLAISLMPAHIQPSITTLYNFYAELDSLPAKVSDPMLGEIRCQWWRDTISNNTPQSPLSEALLTAIEKNNWSKATLISLIDAKIFDLYTNPMQNTASFEAYAGQTHSALLQLTAISIDIKSAKLLSNISGHLGVAYTVAKCLTHHKLHQSRNQIFIPPEFSTQQDFAKFGQTHYKAAQFHLKDIKNTQLFPAILPALRANLSLTTHRPPSQLSVQWQLLKANISKKF